MLISLDYDDTYTEDPDLWLTFVKHAKAREHQVMLVTMRYPHEGSTIDQRLIDVVDRVIYTGRQGKKAFLNNMGIYPNVIIDDMPEFWLFDAR